MLARPPAAEKGAAPQFGEKPAKTPAHLFAVDLHLTSVIITGLFFQSIRSVGERFVYVRAPIPVRVRGDGNSGR